MEPIVSMQQITKAFGSVVANKKVSFQCYPGEVVCLLGENGAGKTTLMNVLYGRYRPDSGRITYQGEAVFFSSPRDAIAKGIQMVHQHFMLVNTLSVADNVVMGKEPKKNALYDRSRAEELVADLSSQYGLSANPKAIIRDLSVGEMQRVEIIKALYQGAQVLILDEPTASLTPKEVEDLFVVIERLKKDGKSIILITHKLKETMTISDRVCVMRQGEMVAERRTSETNIDELSTLMVGEHITSAERDKTNPGEPMLIMRNVSMDNGYGKLALNNISLEVRAGEILGIAGVDGNGQNHLQMVLSGIDDTWDGEIEFCGKSIKGLKSADLISLGISTLFSNRHKYGMAAEASILDNYLMGYHLDDTYVKHGLISWRKVKEDAEELMEEYDVRPRDLSLKAGDLSGGNQQKFVAGHSMRSPKLYIAALPIRGIDIKAADNIHSHMNALKRSGCAILMISSDLDEIIEMSDRIAVIYDGRILDCRPAEEFSLAKIGNLMGGHVNE